MRIEVVAHGRAFVRPTATITVLPKMRTGTVSLPSCGTWRDVHGTDGNENRFVGNENRFCKRVEVVGAGVRGVGGN